MKLPSILTFALLTATTQAQLPSNYQLKRDWLLDNSSFKASITEDKAAKTITLSNGLFERVISTELGTTIAFNNLMTGQTIIRAVEQEGSLTVNGVEHSIGGVTGQTNKAFIDETTIKSLVPAQNALKLIGREIGKPKERLAWGKIRRHAPGGVWPPNGAYLRLDYHVQEATGANAADSPAAPSELGGNALFSDKKEKFQSGLLVSVHYEIYDGAPSLSKWITVTNNSDQPINIDRFNAETLSVVEKASPVEDRRKFDREIEKPDALDVETDMAMGAPGRTGSDTYSVFWKTDPIYKTQVNYYLSNPCLLKAEPARGPDLAIGPGKTFESFHVFELVQDSTDRERRGLALRQNYRIIAPWVTENPIMLHCISSDPAVVKTAIDQAAETGFEMVILSFRSGFDMENNDAAYHAQWKEINDYAKSKNIELGSYSLYSSRSIGGGNDVVPPDGIRPTHGNCPAITSAWGQEYLKKLHDCLETTGFTVFEHDGPYPGDEDITARPPLQKGLDDSRWVHWRIWTDFYKHLRAKGVYMNLPDYYYLNGSNKSSMGYREVNWSLPRAQQQIHTRQNIYDGTWLKTPSMGWMFVPLTQYHGGGAAATIEPLKDHLPHYKAMMLSNLALGVQACYRGTRIYDTPETKKMVTETVDWFKQYRDILESDIIHGRRADGLDLDWMLHVNPTLQRKAMLCVFNPTDKELTKEISVPLYYTGLTGEVSYSENGNPPATATADSNHRLPLKLTVPANGFSYIVFE